MLEVFILTSLIVISLSIYALKTKTDFTFTGGIFINAISMIIGVYILLFFLLCNIKYLIKEGIVVFIFGLWIIYDS